MQEQAGQGLVGRYPRAGLAQGQPVIFLQRQAQLRRPAELMDDDPGVDAVDAGVGRLQPREIDAPHAADHVHEAPVMVRIAGLVSLAAIHVAAGGQGTIEPLLRACLAIAPGEAHRCRRGVASIVLVFL